MQSWFSQHTKQRKGSMHKLSADKEKGFYSQQFCLLGHLISLMFPRLIYIWVCQVLYLSGQHGSTKHQAKLYFLGCSRVLPLLTHLWTHWAGFRYIKMFRDLTAHLVLDQCLKDSGNLEAWFFFTCPLSTGIALAVHSWNARKLWKAFCFSQGRFLLEWGIGQVTPSKVWNVQLGTEILLSGVLHSQVWKNCISFVQLQDT